MTESGSVTSHFPSVLFSSTCGGCRVINMGDTVPARIYRLSLICGGTMPDVTSPNPSSEE